MTYGGHIVLFYDYRMEGENSISSIPLSSQEADELYQEMVYEGCFTKYDSQDDKYDWRPDDNEKDRKEELDFYAKGKVLWHVGIIGKHALIFSC